MQTRDVVESLHNFGEYSQPSECLGKAMLTWKTCFIAFIKQFLKIRGNLKRHNRVYILSSKHTYRPMRARVLTDLFCNLL